MQASVAPEANHSTEFAVTNGGKQVWVLVPTFFSLYLSAMLEVAFGDSLDCVSIQTRHNANLFNVSHFKARTKTSRKIVRALLSTDGSALVAHDAESMQRLVDRFSSAADQFSLNIIIKKTEFLFQPVQNINIAQTPVDILVYYEALLQTKNFVYLGSTITDNARIDSEPTLWMGKVIAAYRKLLEWLLENYHVLLRVKYKVYKEIVLTALLYGAET